MSWNSLALKLVVAAIVFAAGPTPGSAQTLRENTEARWLFNDGNTLHMNGNYVEAERKFREALTRYPKSEQADKIHYYLIDSLVRLRRINDARTEIEKFRKNYPTSDWMIDVDEKVLELGGQPSPASDVNIWNSPAELRESQLRADLLRGALTPEGPRNQIYNPEFPSNPSMYAESLRQLIRLNPQGGIEEARERIRMNPSDPVVAVNLGNIANTESPQAVRFLLSVWGNVASSPNMRNQAFFWFARMNPDKEEVARAIMDLLAKRETQATASEALYRMTVADHRAVLEKIVNSSNPEKFALMDKIYASGSVLLRTDLLMFVARLNDPRSVPFLIQAAQNDHDASVRSAAVRGLGSRKDVGAEVFQQLLRSQPPTRPTRGQQTNRFTESPAQGSAPGSAVVPLSTIPLPRFQQ